MIGTKEEWKAWIAENSVNKSKTVNELLKNRFREEGEVGIRKITCPPGIDSERWEEKINDFLLSRAFGLDGWK